MPIPIQVFVAGFRIRRNRPEDFSDPRSVTTIGARFLQRHGGWQVENAARGRRSTRSAKSNEPSRLIVDGLRPADAAVLFQYRSDPAVARYQGWRPRSESDAADFIAAQSTVAFATAGHWSQRSIRLRDGGALIGDLGLHFPDESDGAVELGISLAPPYQGHGYAREALALMLDLLFGPLAYRRAIASVDPRNLPSVSLLRALGMRQEAHHVASLFLQGEWVDDLVFALLASEWPVDTGSR